MKQRAEFLAALRKGDKAALEELYQQLKGQGDDQAFWAFLKEQLPSSGAIELTDAVALLRTEVGARDFGGFVRTAPVAAVMAFLALAMLTSCQSASDSPPASSAQPTLPPAAEQAAATATVAPPSQSPAAESQPPTLSADELRSRLLDYIVKAQLSASEKRRLKAVLQRTQDPKLIDSRTQLTELFEKASPLDIAESLEAMVLFHADTKNAPGTGKRPIRTTKYKGVDFNSNLSPAMTTLYKGVRFPKA